MSWTRHTYFDMVQCCRSLFSMLSHCILSHHGRLVQLLSFLMFWYPLRTSLNTETIHHMTTTRNQLLIFSWFNSIFIMHYNCCHIKCSLKDLYLYRIPGQGLLLHDSFNVSFPKQSSPPSNATWPIFLRAIRFPTPQDLEQSAQLSHSDHSQSTEQS